MGKVIGQYQLLEFIGQGAYGRVYKAQHRSTGEIVAIKVVSALKLTSQKLIDNLDREIKILQAIKHPQIVNLIEVFESKGETNLVMEFCQGGDFAGYMKSRGRLSEELARFFLQQIAAALEFMRFRKLIHRDLKPSNLLLSSKDDRPVLKVADFGYARHIDPTDLAQTTCGSPLYMAPEILESQKYNAKADLWSVGCILYEMVIGRVPFMARGQVELFEKIKTQELAFPDDPSISSSCKDLLKRLLKKNPGERITFEEFFFHPFLEFEKFPRGNFFNRDEVVEDFTPPDFPTKEEEVALKRQVDEALQSIDNEIVSMDGSPKEPSFTRPRSESASSMNSDSAQGSSVSRPKTKPYKDISPQPEAEDEYVVVNTTAMEVNAIADVYNSHKSAATTGRSPPSAVSRPAIGSSLTNLSTSPPFSLAFPFGSPPFPSPSPSSSPSVSALTRALQSTATLLYWNSSTTTPEEQSARDILSSVATLSKSATSSDERAIWKSIINNARRAYAVVDLALMQNAKDSLESEEDANYQAYILFLKALSIISVAMGQAKRFWQIKGQAITSPINQVVQFLRDKFNEYIEKAEELNLKLAKTKYGPILKTNRIYQDQARLIFERGREVGKEAGVEEVIGNLAIAERFYVNALTLFEVLTSREYKDKEVLSESDRRIVEKYATFTAKRLAQLQHNMNSEDSLSGNY